METRANYVLIGLFTLATIFGAGAFIYWFQNLGGTGERTSYRVLFEGSVSGLRTGSAVLFNGIRVGEVTRLDFDRQNPSQVFATMAVDKNTPVQADTRVGLEFQGLTGIASLSLQGGSASSPPLAASGEAMPTLKADPALTQDVTQAAREVLAKLDKVVVDNQDALRASLRNIEAVTSTLARNTDRFDHIMAGLDNLAGGPEGNGEIQKAARSISAAGESVRGLAENLDKRATEVTAELGATGASVRELAESLDKRAQEISAGINRFSSTGAREFESLSADARRTLGTVDRAVRNLDKNPQRLLFGGGNALPEYNGRR